MCAVFRADVAVSVGHLNAVLPINVQNEALSRNPSRAGDLGL